MKLNRWWLFLSLLWSGCATTRLVHSPEPFPPDVGQVRVVVLEPFFDSAQWNRQTRNAAGYVLGPTGVVETTIQIEVMEKHLYARVPALAVEHQELIREVRRLRPSWTVLSPGELSSELGDTAMVRVVVGDMETVGTNRAQQNLACVFGMVIPPLLLLAAQPVEETHRVYGWLERYQAPTMELASRRLRYVTQPDMAVDTRGLVPLARPFGLDVTFEEGVLASESHRDPVLLRGFARRLAQAVVALVEEQG